MSGYLTILEYVGMKTDRAKAHLDAFNQIATDFLPKAYTVATKDDVKNARCVRRTEFNAIPPVLGMELGEFLYCLRSGLDQMAWQLATPNARKSLSKEISFPIIEKVANSKDRRNLRNTLSLFPDNVGQEIDALQPYKGPDPPQSHPLWQLNKLCNIDKHCLIPVHSRAKDIFIPSVPGVSYNPLASENAVEVSVPLQFKHYFDFDPQTPGDIELGEWESDLVIPRHRLTDMYDFITCTLIARFAQFNGPGVLPSELIKYGPASPIYRMK